jgi:hypothetical protein
MKTIVELDLLLHTFLQGLEHKKKNDPIIEEILYRSQKLAELVDVYDGRKNKK